MTNEFFVYLFYALMIKKNGRIPDYNLRLMKHKLNYLFMVRIEDEYCGINNTSNRFTRRNL